MAFPVLAFFKVAGSRRSSSDGFYAPGADNPARASLKGPVAALKSAAAALVAAGLAICSTPATAGPTLVVDLSSGQVLHAEQATRPWYPASLTKLMTAYVALDAVRRGKITLQTPMRVSYRAYRMAPSKMAFRPGVEVTLENALKIIMVKSANDVSVTIAEGISGSVEGFAAEMNATAKALGMRESHFVNPNGLHHAAHVSSARDMAILARALFLHFPNHHELYGIGAIRYGRRVMRNHNGLIGRYPGANGMKTGYVCASGYNVVASATRYGRTIIAVVLGSPSGVVRTFQAMALLDKGFASSSYGAGQVQSLPRSGYGTPPNMRPEICNRGRRRQLIRQYMSSIAPTAAASSSSTYHSYADTDNNSAAAFFAADRNKSFTSTSGPASGDVSPSGWPRLPPRASFVPIRVYTGRAPGWTGKAAGPTPVDTAPNSDDASKTGNTTTAANSDEKAGKPLGLPGARHKAKRAKAKKSNKAALRKKRARKSRSARRTRARGRRNARISRKASASRKARLSKKRGQNRRRAAKRRR